MLVEMWMDIDMLLMGLYTLFLKGNLIIIIQSFKNKNFLV